MLLFGKVIFKVKNGVFDISLLSHANEAYFNKMILYDVSIFSVEKETYLSTIYNISHPCPDSMQEYISLYENYQGVSYGLDDVNNNDSDFEDM